MEISLYKAVMNDASIIHELQIQSFTPLMEKYLDYDTSPANESIERIADRINQSFTDYYLIKYSDIAVGGIRIVKKDDKIYRVSPIFILPEYQGRGIAQKVFALVDEIYNDARKWELETVLQEQGNCYLYEKLGFRKTGKTKVINDKMTLVFYEK